MITNSTETILASMPDEFYNVLHFKHQLEIGIIIFSAIILSILMWRV